MTVETYKEARNIYNRLSELKKVKREIKTMSDRGDRDREHTRLKQLATGIVDATINLLEYEFKNL